MTRNRHAYAAAIRSRRLTSASALLSASARIRAWLRVPASEPAERDRDPAVPIGAPAERPFPPLPILAALPPPPALPALTVFPALVALPAPPALPAPAAFPVL